MAALTKDQISAIEQILREAAGAAITRASTYRNQKRLTVIPVWLFDEIVPKTQKPIVDHLRLNYPNDGIIAEDEAIRRDSTTGMWWAINPLDGRRDFIRGSQEWSVSIGRYDNDGKGLFGCAYFPSHDQMVIGGKDIRPTLNGTPLTQLGPARLQRIVAIKITDRNLTHDLPSDDDQPNWTIRRSDKCTTSELFDVATGQIDGFCSNDERNWTALPMLPIIEALGGKRKFQQVADRSDEFMFTCGNSGFTEDMVQRILKVADQ